MKTSHRSALRFLVIPLAVLGFFLAAAPWAKSADPKSAVAVAPAVDVVANLTKERDEAKAQVVQLQANQQQQALVSEYYKAVAEKNETILRLVAVQQQLVAAQAELATAKAELEALKKPAETKK